MTTDKRKEYLWLVIHAVARRVVPLLLGAILGLLADAGLLDGHLSDAAQQALQEPSGSKSFPAPPSGPYLGPK